jgi:hypothetical protein
MAASTCPAPQPSPIGALTALSTSCGCCARPQGLTAAAAIGCRDDEPDGTQPGCGYLITSPMYYIAIDHDQCNQCDYYMDNPQVPLQNVPRTANIARIMHVVPERRTSCTARQRGV